MKYVMNSLQSQKYDEFLMINKNITSLQLMEKAGKKIANSIIKTFPVGKVLLLCGKSGNGGDGLVIARYLMEKKYEVDVYLIDNNLSFEAKENLKKYKGNIIDSINLKKEYMYIIDALIGVGLKNELNQNYQKLIKTINELKAIKISVDIPTGLNANNGMMLPIAINADYTYAIQNYKLGHFYNYGKDMCGRVILINIDNSNVLDIDYVKMIEFNELKKYFPQRKSLSNKGDYGVVSIIAGSYDCTGAPILTLKSALKMGAGYVRLCVIDKLYEEYLKIEPSSLKMSFISQDNHFKYNPQQLDKIIKDSDSIVIGMGCGDSYDIYQIINYLLENYNKRLLIDADGINALAKYGISILKNKKCEVILTPHMKEFSRLINKTINEISLNPIYYITEFSKEYNLCVLLKNNISLCCFHNYTYINIAGNASLAKAGSGDVLSGIIGSLLAYLDKPLEECGIVGSMILGYTSDVLLENFNEYCLNPQDIIEGIKLIMNKIVQ